MRELRLVFSTCSTSISVVKVSEICVQVYIIMNRHLIPLWFEGFNRDGMSSIRVLVNLD